MQEKIRLVNLESISPYFNLAAEEYFLQQTSENIVMLWQNDNTIVIGRYQNTIAEINAEYVEKKKINVVRRLTGGGAVFHDIGNVNFTFIKNINDEDKAIDFSNFLKPILAAIRQLGVPAEFSGRNDIVVDGKKISGNAMAFFKNRVLEHGTLLFSSEQTDIASALKADPLKFTDKAVKSVRKRVANISEYMETKMNVSEFKSFIVHYMIENQGVSEIKPLTTDETDSIRKLAEEKYNTWEWNYGKSPKYTLNRRIRTRGGILQAMTDVQNGHIQNVKFYGDFFSKNNPDILAAKFIGTEHSKDNLIPLIHQVKIDDYFYNVSENDLLQLLF